MFVNEIRRAIEASPRVRLPEVAALLWRAYGAGQVSETEAEELSTLIELRKVPPATPQNAPGCARRAFGSRPRSSASLERRRRWAASGRLPPQLACRFTIAEQAVLAVVAVEVVKRGDCRLAIGHLAALAGVSETTVRNAFREARRLGLVRIEERRLSAWRSDTNVVGILSPEWSSWLRLGRQGGGCKSVKPTPTRGSHPVSSRLSDPSMGCRRAGSDSGLSRSGRDRWSRSP